MELTSLHFAGRAGATSKTDQGVGDRETETRVSAARERRANQGRSTLFLFCEIFSLVQKVLEDENVALVALLGNLKTQLSQVARYLQINTDISPIGPESDPSMALSQTELTYAFKTILM